jgi:hypothetical protein
MCWHAPELLDCRGDSDFCSSIWLLNLDCLSVIDCGILVKNGVLYPEIGWVAILVLHLGFFVWSWLSLAYLNPYGSYPCHTVTGFVWFAGWFDALVGFGLTSMGPLLHDPGTLVPIGTSEAGLLVAADFSPYFAWLWVIFACLYMLSVVGDPDNYMTLWTDTTLPPMCWWFYTDFWLVWNYCPTVLCAWLVLCLFGLLPCPPYCCLIMLRISVILPWIFCYNVRPGFLLKYLLDGCCVPRSLGPLLFSVLGYVDLLCWVKFLWAY